MHRFREAEAIARRLVEVRDHVLDHALLGDSLMEQGRLDEAVEAYQHMADLKPGLQSYTRIAHLRWLTGDLEGAVEMMQLAVESGTARAAEPLAWAATRLAAYQWQGGDAAAARQLSARALELVPEYAPALLLRGRILLGEGKAAEAIAPLQLAADRNPLPEVQWTLADALREAGESTRAEAVERQLEARGASSDPRSFSLYLATRREQPAKALLLAQQELEARRDVFTFDALAWAQWRDGQAREALANAELALGAGTQDARLFLHAGVISAAAGQRDAARGHLEKANDLRPMLLPSERTLLDAEIAALGSDPAQPLPQSLTSNQNR